MKEIFKNLPIIETNRCILRPIKEEDYLDMYEYTSVDEVTKYLVFPTHKTPEDSLNAIKEYFLKPMKNGEPRSWAIEYKENGKMIGTAGFNNYIENIQCTEIGYVINQNYWGKGLMTEVVKGIIKFGFEKLNLNRIQARHHIDNMMSGRVIQKCGMKFEGILREYTKVSSGEVADSPLYSILRSEYFNRKEG